MDAHVFESTATMCLTEIRSRLDQAAKIASAASACAAAGGFAQAVEITMDIDQPLYEATTLLNALSLIKRIVRTD